MKLTVHSLCTKLILLAFFAGFFFSGQSSTTCLAFTPDEHLVGGACTAEAVSMATIWSWSESTTALPAQKLLLLAIAFIALAIVIFPRVSSSTRGLTWFNQRLNLARLGSAPADLFLPYLFATHGW